MKAIITLTALLLLHLCLAQNNAPPLHCNLLSIKDGMPVGTVRDLLQDKEGYIWIATKKGLVRYDGYSPKVYDFGIKDPYGIVVNSLIQDNTDRLWAAVDSGLYKYDRANDSFVPFIKKPIINITEDKAGNLWLINADFAGIKQNLILFNPATKKEVLFGMEIKGKYHINTIWYIEVFKDKEQRIWVGSGNGLYEYNEKDNTFIPHFAAADSSKQIAITHIQEDATLPGIFYFEIFNPHNYTAVGLGSYNSNTGSFTIFHHDAKDINSIGGNTVWQVQNDSKGRLWVLTDAGLSLFNPAAQTFTNYTANAFKYNLGYDYDIQEDKLGNLWCNSNYGLFYFDATTRQFTQYTADQKSKGGLVSNYAHNLMIDHSGILWFGTEEGLQWVDTKHHRFTKYADNNTAQHLFKGGWANSFAKASDGTIWLGTEHGLSHWLPQQDSFQFIKFAPSADENTFVTQVVYDSKGLIWFYAYFGISAHTGLYCYKPSTGKSISYRYRQNDTTSLSNDAVNVIYEDHLGDIWIGTWGGGICRFNRHTQSFTRFPFSNNLTLSDTYGALDDGQVNCIYEDKEGVLLVGTNNGGLNRFDRQQGTFTSYAVKLPGLSNVTTITEDSKGKLWAGTSLGGLFELNRSRDSIKRITEKDGLLYDGAIATAEDNAGNIWVTSQRGITILNPVTGQVRTLTENSDLYAYSHYITKTNTGDFLLGTREGFIVLDPKDYAPDTNAPLVYIEEMHLAGLVNNKPKDSLIVVDAGKSFQFKYNENRVSFHYVGLYYQDALRTQYAYKLDGYDKDWVPAGTQRTVTYNNLAPGTYTFYVKAANSDGVWSKDDSTPFTITPPWWNTWWFRLLVGLMIGGILYGLYSLRIKQIRKEQRIRSKLAGDLHDDLGATLNSVKIFTNLALMESEPNKYLLNIKEGIQEAITIIRDIIWVLDDKRDSLEDLRLRINQFVQPLCEANSIQYKLNITDGIRGRQLSSREKRNFYLILKEAVNNAIKYATATKIEINITSLKERLAISIKDNGKGFKRESINEGNGLKNMQQRAKEIKYHIDFDSTPGNGTSIFLEKI